MIDAIGDRLNGLGKKILEWGKDEARYGVEKTGAFILLGVQSHQRQRKQENSRNKNNIFFAFISVSGHR